MYICIYEYISMNIYESINTCAYIYIYIYKSIYIYIYINSAFKADSACRTSIAASAADSNSRLKVL